MLRFRRAALGAAAAGLLIAAGLATPAMAANAAPAGGQAPTCVVNASPNDFIESGLGSEHSSVAFVITVECQPTFSEQYVEIHTPQLFNACQGQLRWYNAATTAVVAGSENLEVQLDDDGNATAIVLGGPSCAASWDLIEADLTVAPYTTATTQVQIAPPVSTRPGVFALPASQVEELGHLLGRDNLRRRVPQRVLRAPGRNQRRRAVRQLRRSPHHLDSPEFHHLHIRQVRDHDAGRQRQRVRGRPGRAVLRDGHQPRPGRTNRPALHHPHHPVHRPCTARNRLGEPQPLTATRASCHPAGAARRPPPWPQPSRCGQGGPPNHIAGSRRTSRTRRESLRGSTSETHIGKPPGVEQALYVPAEVLLLTAIPQVDVSAHPAERIESRRPRPVIASAPCVRLAAVHGLALLVSYTDSC